MSDEMKSAFELFWFGILLAYIGMGLVSLVFLFSAYKEYHKGSKAMAGVLVLLVVGMAIFGIWYLPSLFP